MGESLVLGERRRALLVPVRGFAVLYASDGPLHGMIENLSQSGALVSVAGRPLWRQGIQPRLVPPADAQGQALIARIRPASAAKLQASVLQYMEGPAEAYTLVPALAYRRVGTIVVSFRRRQKPNGEV